MITIDNYLDSHYIHRSNWLRAAVLGANDGIISISSLAIGVAAASSTREPIILATVAGLVAGALSMAAGEFVSVSSQRDSEKALLRKEHFELTNNPEAEQEELVEIYRAKGLSRTTAQQVAQELTEHDAFAAHAEAELKLDPNDLNNPWQAAIASALAFLANFAIGHWLHLRRPRSTRSSEEYRCPSRVPPHVERWLPLQRFSVRRSSSAYAVAGRVAPTPLPPVE